MTTFKVVVEDEQADEMRNLLKQVPFVKTIEEEQPEIQNTAGPSSLEKIKKILDDAKGKNLFADIEDPSEWQRELRKEWDRDF